MGNGQSLATLNPAHVRIYRNLLGIQSPQTRSEMIRTLMAGQEYVMSARTSGVYAHLLAYIARVDAGQQPAALPGEMAMRAVAGKAAAVPQPQHQMIEYGVNAIRPAVQQRPSAVVTKGRRNEKALNYFQSCLQVLGLEEEVALTETALKKAYKRAGLKAHPDKGGSEEEFEAVTRAHAYLGEILRRINGGRATEGKMDVPENLVEKRAGEATAWDLGKEPVRLNPQKLDMNLFNKMFEETRIPDPDDDGYGDWLKGSEGGNATAPRFSGKFNRDAFNSAFEEEAAASRARSGRTGHELAMRQPEALTLAPTAGVELGRGKSESYTAAANANLKFTDLRSAYTDESTIVDKVADVRVEARSYDQYSAQWKQAPKPLEDGELAAIAAAEKMAVQREKNRQVRAAEELAQSDDFFARMKRLVITDGSAAGGGTKRPVALQDNTAAMRRLTNK